MATATITSAFTVLSDCTSATGWSGTSTADTEVVKQGTTALSGTLRTTGTNTKFFTTSSINLTGQHLRIWINFASIGFLDTKANGGIRLAITSASGTGYWYVGGSDTYGGGWELFTVDCDRAFDSGTSTRTGVTSVGFALQLTGAPRNAINTWWDFLTYGNGYSVTGGTVGDPLTMANIFTADTAGGYGMVRRINGVYYINSALTIGSSSTATSTYFSDSNQLIVFEDQPVASTLYKLDATSSGTNTTGFNLTGSVVKSASTATRFNMNLNSTNVTVGSVTNNTFANAAAITFKNGQTATGNVFRGCNRITTNGATFTNNTVADSTDATGALLWNASGISSCSFSNNSRAIAITAQGTYTFNALTFSGNTFDVINSSAGATTVNATNGSNPSTVTNTGGGSLTFVNAKSFTITNIMANSEVRLFRQSDLVELGGVEDVTTASGATNVSCSVDPDNAGRYRVLYSYTYASDTPIFVVALTLGTLPVRMSAILKATDGSLQLAQTTDRQYLNP